MVWSLGQEYPLKEEMQPTPVFLLGESHGKRRLAGYSPWGGKESDTTEQLHFHFHLWSLLRGLKCSLESGVGTIANKLEVLFLMSLRTNHLGDLSWWYLLPTCKSELLFLALDLGLTGSLTVKSTELYFKSWLTSGGIPSDRCILAFKGLQLGVTQPCLLSSPGIVWSTMQCGLN